MLTPHQQSFSLAGIISSSFLYVSPLEQRKVISAENQLILVIIAKWNSLAMTLPGQRNTI